MNLIVAVDNNWGIGKDGTMPWHISADLKYFKEKTLGGRVIMGRKTLLSFPNQKPLPSRENIVISSNKDYVVDGAKVINSLSAVSEFADEKTFVIGGGSVYASLLPYCKYAYVTKIDGSFDCDTYFPNLDDMENWKMVDEGEELLENGIAFRFTVYENDSPLSFEEDGQKASGEMIEHIDYNENKPSMDEVDFNELEFLCEVDNDFDADVKVSLLRSCSILAFKRYAKYSAVAKIYCGSSNLGVMIYVPKDKLCEAREILESGFDENELYEN